MSQSDIHYMQHCLTLAEKGGFKARPNPLVGALVVKDDEIVAEGWHKQAGQAHAEINALEAAGDKSQGATLYVTLEPCSFTGKTGPCSEAVVASGVSRVVYGMVDPNPKVSGGGLEVIRAAGINVDGPVLEQEAMALNPGFIKSMTTGLPFLRCKLAMSLDGRTAMASGESKWITGPEAREQVQKLRAGSGAIITGIETVLADDPGLDVRSDLDCEQPIRVIVDSSLRIEKEAKILNLPGEIVIVTAVSSKELLAEKQKSLGNDNVTLYSCANADGKVNLDQLLRYLVSDKQCLDILLESGAQLAGAMLAERLIDEIITYIAPSLLGSEARPLFNLHGLSRLEDRIDLEIMDVAMAGKDCRMRTRPVYQKNHQE
jgi:diaminohydroxyphosphoribosylaminopyrimidine deaminase/5-amino-6-(5-phosphoribosylamino)uracil reductase